MGLSREQILEAALALVDEHGVKKLTMRGVGAALGVEAMSLYRYVENKSDLLDGLMEAVLAEVDLPAPTGDWKADAVAAGTALFSTFARHPRTLELFASRPAVTPGSLEVLEHALRLLGQDGSDTVEALARFNVLFGYAVGFASTQLPHPDDGAFAVAYDQLPKGTHPHLSVLREVLEARDVQAEFHAGLVALVTGWR